MTIGIEPVGVFGRLPGTKPTTRKRSIRRDAAFAVESNETVLRSFYAHSPRPERSADQPVPAGHGARVDEHHNPMTPWHSQWVGLSRPQRILRQIPDAVFNVLFARLSLDRDRALSPSGSPPEPGVRAARVLRSGTGPGRPLEVMSDTSLLPGPVAVKSRPSRSGAGRALLSGRRVRPRGLRRVMPWMSWSVVFQAMADHTPKTCSAVDPPPGR
ncbi:hypothetical protein [Streptomyces sp. x-80]|uniref:hypothetical protein n=1 Tax=Streptomyces sp. x-80 TaxID=2789282 RepID=UPI00398152F3